MVAGVLHVAGHDKHGQSQTRAATQWQPTTYCHTPHSTAPPRLDGARPNPIVSDKDLCRPIISKIS